MRYLQQSHDRDLANLCTQSSTWKPDYRESIHLDQTRLKGNGRARNLTIDARNEIHFQATYQVTTVAKVVIYTRVKVWCI